jgi:ribosomal peptide maturation radical SAM protein 1
MFDPDWAIGPDKKWRIRHDFSSCRYQEPIMPEQLRHWERHTEHYLQGVATAVSERRYRIAGCSTSFEQTAASVALLNRIKALRKDTVTILGGANCEGEMARGMGSLSSSIDYIFSGESEGTFVKFVRDILAGLRPQGRILCGEPWRDLDALPTPTFVEFYQQRRQFLPRSELPGEHTEIPYETSRGCWWGEKHHCTFCGFNEKAIVFRQKSPQRIIQDLHTLLDTHPTKKVSMTDSCMPRAFFKTLLPRLTGEFPGMTVFYEQRANLSLPQILALKRAGITSIQPGIESLSSRLLRLIKKGVQARQNLLLLRYARSAGVDLQWNLLWGFPGDDVKAYEETLAILPLLHHLQPPVGMVHLSIDRFSPYFSKPLEFGVRNIKPLKGYYDFLPAGADIERIASFFTAEYSCGAHEHIDVIRRLWEEMARWRAAWKQDHGAHKEDLKLFARRGSFELVDTRGLWAKKRSFPLDDREASTLLTAGPYSGTALEAWAFEKKLAVIVDGWFVPLAVAEAELLLELTRRHEQGLPAGDGSL